MFPLALFYYWTNKVWALNLLLNNLQFEAGLRNLTHVINHCQVSMMFKYRNGYYKLHCKSESKGKDKMLKCPCTWLINHHALKCIVEWKIGPPILISVLYEVGMSASRSSCFTLGKEAPVPIVQEVGWAPEPIWSLANREMFSAPKGIESR
jgi:hypothetical protein